MAQHVAGKPADKSDAMNVLYPSFGYLKVRNIVTSLYLSFLEHGFGSAGQLFHYDQ